MDLIFPVLPIRPLSPLLSSPPRKSAFGGRGGSHAVALATYGLLKLCRAKAAKVRSKTRLQSLQQAEALQRAWLFDASLACLEKISSKHPRITVLKAAALAGLERFSEARNTLEELNWNDLLVAAEPLLILRIFMYIWFFDEK